MTGVIQAAFMNLRSFTAPPGQQAYTTAGTYSWVAPSGVTSVSVVAVGGGQGGTRKQSICCPCFLNVQGSSGAGGSLAYKNNYSVTPGNSYTVIVGAGGAARNNANGHCGGPSCPASGGSSSFCSSSILRAKGAGLSDSNVGTAFYVGGGTNNCTASWQGAGGGGAAGYSGCGGQGQANLYSGGSGGSGGGGGGGGVGCPGCASNSQGGSGGGGVGILGEGSSGNKGAANTGGQGGSGGACGSNKCGSNGGNGGAYGGGGGGMSGRTTNPAGRTAGAGAVGAVRIIWPGTTRSFPSTCTGDK